MPRPKLDADSVKNVVSFRVSKPDMDLLYALHRKLKLSYTEILTRAMIQYATWTDKHDEQIKQIRCERIAFYLLQDMSRKENGKRYAERYAKSIDGWLDISIRDKTSQNEIDAFLFSEYEKVKDSKQMTAAFENSISKRYNRNKLYALKKRLKKKQNRSKQKTRISGKAHTAIEDCAVQSKEEY